eukprot:scaffold92642_cov50-Phaeocystis_antarctica.AAC.1
MPRVHVAPSATANGTLEVYGAPPLSVVPSEQLRFQVTSLGYDPPEHVIAEGMVKGVCEGGRCGGGEGGSGAGAGEDGVSEGGSEGGGKGEDGAVARSTGSHCGGQVTPFPWRINSSVRIQRPDEASSSHCPLVLAPSTNRLPD